MIYLIILFIILSLTLYFDASGKEPPDNSYYWGIYLVFVFLMGLRYRVGGDTLAYIEYYKTVLSVEKLNKAYFLQAHAEFGYGVLWTIFCSVCKWFTNSFVLFQFVHALIVNGIIFYFFITRTKYVFTNILFYAIFYFFTLNTEILREALAIGVFILSLDSFFNRKWIKYCLYVFVAAQFHASAYILLIVPFFLLLRKVSLTLVFIVGVSLIIAIPSIQGIILDYVVSHLEEGHIKWKIILYCQHELNANGLIFITFVKVLMPFVLLVIEEKILKVKSMYKPFVLAYIFFSLLTIYIIPFNRLAGYLVPLFYVWFTEFVANMYKSEFFRPLSRVVILFVLLIVLLPKGYYYTNDMSDKVPDTHFYNRWIPYYTVFNKQESEKREELVKTYNYKKYEERNKY